MDLVLRARSTGDLALLDEAERVARDGYDWFAIAESFAVAKSDRAAYCLSRALADAGDDVRVFRNVARIQRGHLKDAEAAARSLATCANVLLASDTSSSSWCLLADAWFAHGDRDAALDYLAHARASAKSVEEHCEVSERTFEIAGRAEVIANARTAREHVWMAKACDHVQDLDGHLAHLAAAIDTIESVGDAVLVASALERFDVREDLARCYQQGRRRALSVDDWLALMTIAEDRERRRCLEAAEAIANDDELRRVGFFRQRSGTAPQVPATLAPQTMLLEGARSLGWPHAPAALFDELRRTISRAQIERIAACDYGMDYEAHLAAIDAIVQSGKLPHPLFWEPGEVLRLERWSEGPSVDHLARAFVCAILCIDDAGPHPWDEGNESTVPVLLHSCIALGASFVDGAIGLFAAMANTHRDSIMGAFVELALVLAAVWRDAGDPRIAPMIRRLHHEEPALRKAAVIVTEGWLLGLTNFTLRHDLWRMLARTVLVDPSPHLVQLAALLRGASSI